MFEIIVSEEIRAVCPQFQGVAVYAEVKNSSFSQGLWDEINTFTAELLQSSQLDDIKKHAVIAATREAYKRCGKDPGRYRPSAEALRRRLLRNIPLYQIDTLVDLINLVSLRTGYSIGGFDADKIQALCLEADDVWMKCMEIKSSIKVVKSNIYVMGAFIDVDEEDTLMVENVGNGKNDIFLRRVIKEYGISESTLTRD